MSAQGKGEQVSRVRVVAGEPFTLHPDYSVHGDTPLSRTAGADSVPVYGPLALWGSLHQ